MDRTKDVVDNFAHLPVPPPPRDDVEDDYDSDEFEEEEEENYDDEDEEYKEDEDDDDDDDDDDGTLDHHIGHRRYQYEHHDGSVANRNDSHFNFMNDNARNKSAPSPSPHDLKKIKSDNNNNGVKRIIAADDDDDEKNNSMLFFGEDTMHVLMDAELRLKSVPPTPSTSSYLSYTPRSNAGAVAAETATATMRGNSSVKNVHERISDNDDDDDGLSTGVASLLRGPIMAANSTISSGSREAMQHHDSGGKSSDDFATGRWKDGGERNITTIHTQQDAIASNLTPSMLRRRFFPDETPTPSQVRNGFADGGVDGSATMKKSPDSSSTRSSISHNFGSASNSGGYQRIHAIHRQKQQKNYTPSVERSQFVPSPQDSVSTMGQLSPSEGYNVVATGPTAGAGGTLMQQHPLKHSSAGCENSHDEKITNNHPAFDGMIALGEEQMRQKTTSVNKNNTGAKKPFLRKGTRREPSALQTRINKSSNGVGLTPSTTRLQQQCISPHSNALSQKSNDGPSHTNAQKKANNGTFESQSARKERLARLEKMQEDLIHDLERRLARKEEACDNRRRVKMTAKKNIVSTAAAADAEACVTPSQVRSPVAATIGIPSLSTSRRGSSGMRNELMTKSRANETPNIQKTGENSLVANYTKNEHRHEDVITPSQARKISSPSAEIIVEKYESKRNVNRVDEEKNVECQSSRDNLRESIGLGNGTRANTKSKQKTVRSKSMPRPRSTIRSNLSKSAAPFDVDDKWAFDEWKKKEADQWALIKNMRKRQEAALREAEGERERAKAWAAAEKESVQKWVTEQRAVIERYRHKAANAALIASKESNKVKVEDSNLEEQKAMKAELDQLRSEAKCQKDKEKTEIKKLKEVIRQQEKVIDALKSSKEGGVGDNTVNGSKNSVGLKPRPVLANGSSKLNTMHQQQPSKSKAPSSRKGRVLIDITEDKLRDEVDETTFLAEEEPSELWLQRHLSKLNNANNRLGEKNTDGMQHHGFSSTEEMYQFANEDNLQRKSYNAADYCGKLDDLPTQAHFSMTHHSNPTVPSIVTAPIPSKKIADQSRSKSQIVTYKNGTQKEVLSDGTITISFVNGDRKRTYANEKKGIVVYYYASTKTTQVTHQDGMQTYHFPNGQIENHCTDGRKEITFPDSSTRIVHTDGSTDTVFADGVRVMDYPDGRQVVVQP